MALSKIDTLLILLTVIILSVVFIMFIIYAFFLKKKGELLIRSREEALEFQHQLSQTKAEIRIQTLNYIGQELHDDIGQKLSVAKMIVNGLDCCDKGKEISTELSVLLGECIKDIRSLSKTFIVDNIKDFDFGDALGKEIKRLEKFNLIDVEYHINNTALKIEGHHALILFRMVQEAINNILKHAHAKKMMINIIDATDDMKIVVEDNGCGMAESTISAGNGLINIKNRAKVINAKVLFNSEPGHGTKILINYKKIRIPVVDSK